MTKLSKSWVLIKSYLSFKSHSKAPHTLTGPSLWVLYSQDLCRWDSEWRWPELNLRQPHWLLPHLPTCLGYRKPTC